MDRIALQEFKWTHLLSAMVLPLMCLVWWWLGQQPQVMLDQAVTPHVHHVQGLKHFASFALWPFAKGWRWASAILLAVTVMRAFGWSKDSALLFGVQGAVLICFIGLSACVPPAYAPQLGVTLYAGTGSALLWVVHQHFDGGVASGLSLIAVPLYLLLLLGAAASGVLPSVLLCCTALGVCSVLTVVGGTRC